MFAHKILFRSIIVAIAHCLPTDLSANTISAVETVNGKVIDVSGQSFTVEKAGGEQIVLSLWGVETNQFLLEFLLLDRTVTCEIYDHLLQNGVIPSGCLIDVEGKTDFPLGVNRFIEEFIRLN